MKIKAGEIGNGQTIKHDGRILKILEKHEITPGRRSAITRLQTIDIHTGNKYELRMSPDDYVEQYGIYNTSHIYSYNDGSNYIFMNQNSYEEISVPNKYVDEEKSKFLAPEQTVDLGLDEDGNFVTIAWPTKVTVKVKYAPVSQKNASVDDRKRVELENGAYVVTPGYVKTGDTLIINLDTMDFISRA